MDTKELKFCATDKEIFDVLIGSKQQITESILFELGRRRGIFYSKDTSREVLAAKLSLLPHDYHDLNAILSYRDHAGRAEKITSITLDDKIDIEDIKAVATELKDSAPQGEKVLANQLASDKYTVAVTYSEIDYSKNRLVQRREREANIEFIVQDSKTLIRMPANAKAESIVAALKERLDGRVKKEIPTFRIDLSQFSDPDARTSFFTTLIKNIEGFQLENVTTIRVDTMDQTLSGDEDEAGTEAAKQDMLAVVKNVAMKGQSLLASSEYQQLREKGFFITSIAWSSRMLEIPFTIVEFEAGFEDPVNGSGFKYSIRGARHADKGVYSKTIRPLSVGQKEYLLSLVEKSATSSVHALVSAIHEK